MSATDAVAPRRRQQQRSGRPQPDGPPALSELGADARRHAGLPVRGPLSTSGIETCATATSASERAAFRIEIGNEGWNFPIGDPYRPLRTSSTAPTSPSSIPKGLKLQGEALIQKLNELMTRQFRMANLVEQEADPLSRVTLSRNIPTASACPGRTSTTGSANTPARDQEGARGELRDLQGSRRHRVQSGVL